MITALNPRRIPDWSPAGSILLTLLLVQFAGCTQSAPSPAPPPLPTPAAAAAPEPVPEPLPATLDEARALRLTDPPKYDRALEALTHSTDAVVARRATTLLALHDVDEKRWDAAALSLPRAADADAVISPFLRLRLVEVLRQRHDFGGAAGVAAQIIATAPDTSAAVLARLRLPSLYAEAGDATSTDSACRQAMQVPIDEMTESEFVDLAAALDQANSPELASSIRMRLLTDYPQGRFTEKTYGALAAMAASPLDALPLDGALALTERLASTDHFDQAFDLFGRITSRFPEAAKNEKLHDLRAHALFRSRNYAEVLREVPATTTDPALALLRARAAWRDDQPKVFLAGLKGIEKRWPRSSEAAEAKILRAKYDITDISNPRASIDNLKRALAMGATGKDGENLWTLGWTYIVAGRDSDALAAFDDYVRRYPDADYTSNALFWSGKLLDKSGRIAERDQRWSQLITLYPYSYFSYRARDLGKASGFTPAANAVGKTFPDLAAELASVADPRLDAVRELVAIDLHRDASREMKRVAAAHPANSGIQFMLADIYIEGGEPYEATGILQSKFREFVRHGGNGIPHRFWEILFPLNYWPAIQSAAAQAHVDPYLVASIIRQESGFEPQTVSNAGAVGLMQIMPAEAQQIATEASLGTITREQLFDPETNIRVGAAEYAQKLAAMHGNEILAIAAYNAGPEAIGNWLAQTPIDDLDRFVEAIPFADTRLYVKTVQRSRFEYRRIYEAESSSTLSGTKR